MSEATVWTFPWEDVSHWLGVQGYEIKEVRLSSDGKSVVFSCVDASVGDAESPIADEAPCLEPLP